VEIDREADDGGKKNVREILLGMERRDASSYSPLTIPRVFEYGYRVFSDSQLDNVYTIPHTPHNRMIQTHTYLLLYM
jgi:hypothetical protein